MSHGSADTAKAHRAAILISGLDAETADLLLEQLDPQQAALIRRAVMELRHVEPEEEQRVLEDFRQACGGSVGNAPAPPPAEPDEFNHDASDGDRPFEFLQDATPGSVAELLSREHPQVVAVVIAHLPPDVAASVMAHWPEVVQADVLARVAHLEELDPTALSALEDAISTLLAGTIRPRTRRSAGVTAVEEIVERLSSGKRMEVMNQLIKRDADLATSLGGKAPRPTTRLPQPPHSRAADRPVASELPTRKPSPSPKPHVEFDDLEHLSASDWAALLSAVESQTMLLALAGASESLLAALRRLAPPDLLRRLEKRIQHLGPLRLEDIDRAQRHIADTAAEEIVAGRISPIQPRHFAAAI